jgi:hypothetical protein
LAVRSGIIGDLLNQSLDLRSIPFKPISITFVYGKGPHPAQVECFYVWRSSISLEHWVVLIQSSTGQKGVVSIEYGKGPSRASAEFATYVRTFNTVPFYQPTNQLIDQPASLRCARPTSFRVRDCVQKVHTTNHQPTNGKLISP